ncbi:hypothetical protein ACWC1C_01330 [Streptomyces sp. NPDC001705]
MAAEEFNIPDLKGQVGWRLDDQDRKDLRIIMADRREKHVSKVLRSLVQREAAAVRQRWTKNQQRIAALERGADG